MTNYRRFKKVSVSLLIVSLAVAFSVPQLGVNAHNGVSRSALAARIPIINGQNDCRWTVRFRVCDEWSDAATFSFNLNIVNNGTVFMKNDYYNLYIAVSIHDPTPDTNGVSSDTVRIFFDNHHVGNAGLNDGDDYLHVRGDGVFQDRFYSAASNSVIDDINAGGTRDGAGAAGYNPATQTWFFEMVHPLCSGDLAHDFCLNLGDTVGWGIQYFEAGNSAGYITNSDYVVASRPFRINFPCIPIICPVPTDVTITGIEVTQAVQCVDNLGSQLPACTSGAPILPLVKGKTTVARVYVKSGPPGALNAPSTVYLYGARLSIGQASTEAASLGGLVATVLAKSNGGNRSLMGNSANFVLPPSWTSNDYLILKAFATTPFESNYRNNWMIERQYTFKLTRNLNVYVVPINSGTNSAPALPAEGTIQAQQDYMQTTFPFARINFERGTWQQVGVWTQGVGGGGGDALNQKLELVWEQIALGRTFACAFFLVCSPVPDIIYGIGQGGGGIARVTWCCGAGLGVAANGGESALGCSSPCPPLMSHETNHDLDRAVAPGGTWGRHISGPRSTDPPGTAAYGCGAAGPDPSWPYNDGQIHEYGLDTRTLTVIPPTTSELMTYCWASAQGGPPWISNYRWQNLFNKFDPPASAVMGTGIDTPRVAPAVAQSSSFLVSGTIFSNGTGSIDDVTVLPGRINETLTPGPYSLALLNSTGQTIAGIAFNAAFLSVDNDTLTRYPFSLVLPFSPSATTLQLRLSNTTLSQRKASLSAPRVSLVMPRGGEVWSGGFQNVTWTASDPDGDPLSFELQYSLDGGVRWMPLANGLKGRSYLVDSSLLPGSTNARIRVIASDGFYTSMSNSSAVFTITAKAATARILSPQAGSQFSVESTILLQGETYDPQASAGVSSPPLAQWSSSLDGPLGNGTTLAVRLRPGLHTLKFSVFGSSGTVASSSVGLAVGGDSFDAVNSTVVLHDVAVQSLSPSRLFAYSGVNSNPIMVSVTIANLGGASETVTVNLAANNTLIGPANANVIVAAQSSAVIVYSWDTSKLARAKYVLSAQATPVPGETEIADNLLVSTDLFEVKLAGDVNGDCTVNIIDLVSVGAAFGSTPGSPAWNPNADLNNDGIVNIIDLVLVASNFGKTC